MTVVPFAAPVVHQLPVEALAPSHTPAVEVGAEERWAAWRARGIRDDAATERRMWIVGVMVVVIIGLVTLMLVLNGGSL